MKLFFFVALFPLIASETDCGSSTISSLSCDCLYGETLNELYDSNSCSEIWRNHRRRGRCYNSNLKSRCLYFSRLCSKARMDDRDACRAAKYSDPTACRCIEEDCHKEINDKKLERTRMISCCSAMLFCKLQNDTSCDRAPSFCIKEN